MSAICIDWAGLGREALGVDQRRMTGARYLSMIQFDAAPLRVAQKRNVFSSQRAEISKSTKDAAAVVVVQWLTGRERTSLRTCSIDPEF